MTKKSARRLERDAEQVGVNMPPERSQMSLVLNSSAIPESVMELMGDALKEGAVITLFPFVGTYSTNMRPLEFGKACQLMLNPHGQLMLRRAENFDRTVEVTDSVPVVLGDLSEFPALWQEAFEESWEKLAAKSA